MPFKKRNLRPGDRVWLVTAESRVGYVTFVRWKALAMVQWDGIESPGAAFIKDLQLVCKPYQPEWFDEADVVDLVPEGSDG